MKKIFRFILVSILCSLLVINTFTVFATELATERNSKYNKIDTILQEKLEDIANNQKISVWVLFDDIDKTKLDNDVEAECEINPDSLSYSLPQPTDEQLKMLQDTSEHDNDWKNDFVNLLSNYKDNTLNYRNEIKNKVREYQRCYRQTSYNMYEENNENYLEKCNISNAEIIFQSSLSPLAILSVTKEKLLEICDFDFVKNIYYYNDDIENTFEEPTNNGGTAIAEIKTDKEIDSMKAYKAREKFGVTGKGINVLMLEAGLPYEDGSGRIDFSNIRYIHNQNEYAYLSSDTQDVDLTAYKSGHAISTTIALQEYASEVNVYSVHRKNYSDSTYNEYSDIEWTIINKDIDILNCSGNYGFNADYSSDIYSLWFDYLVSNYKILLTAAIGNDINYCKSEWHKVHSIASGYNTIGVGAYVSKDFYGNPYENPILCDYRYSSMDYPNAIQYKPDMITDSGSSSEASPKLAAIAALVLEINPYLSDSPDILKAILMASCHKKAVPATGSDIEPEDMFSGLTLRQGAGIVDAYQAICIVLSGSYGIGSVKSGYVEYSNISIPSNDNVNFSLVWLINNTVSDNSNTPDNAIMGTVQELKLDVYEDDVLVCTSNKTNAGKQLAYFEYDKDKDYKFRITKTSTNNDRVNFAYAWSPTEIKELLNVQIQGKNAVNQDLTAITYYTDGTIVDSSDLTYRWYSSANGNTWTSIAGANSQSYQITDNENLKYIKCIVNRKSKKSIFAASTISTNTNIPVIKYGDANLDGNVTMEDVLVIQSYISEVITDLSSDQFRAADVNGDGQLSISDSTLIQKYLSGIIDVFPVEL